MSKTKITLFTLVAILMPFYDSLAQQLEKIPGQEPVSDSDLVGYLDSLYRFGISITGILAVFMIALGAFAYIVTSAGNASKMLDAKEKISNALIGLIIALTAYLFLYVINPDLVRGTLRGPADILNELVYNGGGENSSGLQPGDKCMISGGGPGGWTINSGYPSCGDCPNGLYDLIGEEATPDDAVCRELDDVGEPPNHHIPL
jgi:hypothetical protein